MGTKEKTKVGQSLTVEDAKVAMAHYADAHAKLKEIKAIQEQKINAIRDSYANEERLLSDQRLWNMIMFKVPMSDKELEDSSPAILGIFAVIVIGGLLWWVLS